jgi:hypothetical protein
MKMLSGLAPVPKTSATYTRLEPITLGRKSTLAVALA